MPNPIHIDEQGNVTLQINLWRILKVTLIAIAVTVGGWLFAPHLTSAATICLMIFIGAAGLWVTEAIPPFATAILVIVACVYTLGVPGGPLGLQDSGLTTSYQIFLNPIASPVLVLFFGGLFLARAASKHGLDLRLAKTFIKPFGTQPRMVLLGVMSTTALFSMFMSNTATTAMMIAILHPIFSRFENRPGFKKALVLAVPFAANIGGLGTIIGTPPNAVAASVLASAGHPVSFLQWMIIGVPLACVILILTWALFLYLFQLKTERVEILFPEPMRVTWDLVVVVCTFIVTVLLWLTQPLHHMPAAVVAMLPIMVFPMFGILDRNDLKQLDWDVIILIAGGMTLGVAMGATGLSEILVAQIAVLHSAPFMTLVIFLLLTLLLSNFMSHTAASNILIPIVASMAFISPTIGVLGVAFVSSMAMSLPISTPPNAIAFATHEISTRDMVRYGTLVSVLGVAIIIGALLLMMG